MKQELRPRCKTCGHWWRAGKSDSGDCREKSPVIHIVRVDDRYDSWTLFPETGESGGCSRHTDYYPLPSKGDPA